MNVTGGDWPGVDPQTLVSVVGDLNYSTTLNFTETAVTSGYKFEAASIFSISLDLWVNQMARANYAHRSNSPLFMALTISSLEIENGASQAVSGSGQ